MAKLLIIPTPVGNLEDMTLRGIRYLKEADLILAEDTRQTKKLLQHYQITKPLESHHQHNEHAETARIIQKIISGMTVALVSDCGTPGISDPGFLLARECIKAGIAVETLPGACAFVPALVSSGLPCDRFVFEGFFLQNNDRQKRSFVLTEEDRTIIFYESPFRVLKLLEQVAEVLGEERQACASREISKIYEEHVRGTVKELIAHFSKTEPRGEFVIMITGKETKNKNNKQDEEADQD